MTATATLTCTAITDAGIEAEWSTDCWYAQDADGFEISFGQDENGWWALSEIGHVRFTSQADLLDYVREFIETPANL